MYSIPILNQLVVQCLVMLLLDVHTDFSGQVAWYSHLFQNFPQFVVIHTVKRFGIVNKAEVDVFLEFSCFFNPISIHKFLSFHTQFRW